MNPRFVRAIRRGFLHALASGVIVGALVSTVVAQNYMYGQTGLQTGANPACVVVADFNGDGRLDLATANQGDNTVSIILTKTDGTFAAKVDYPVGNTPAQLVVADFNGDGIADLAVVNSADNTVSLLIGVGDGTFKAQTTISTGNDPTAIASSDFDEDGNADLVVANQGDSTISILLGDGKGGFTTEPPVSLNAAPHFLQVGDVNNDGKPDLFVVATDPNLGDVVFLLTGSGNGAFSVPPLKLVAPSTASGSTIANLVTGDFNNDGNLDVALSTTPQLVNGNFAAYVFMGNGTGEFSATILPLNGTLYPPPVSVAAADFNRDGNLDLALVEEGLGVAIYPGNGDGTFQSPILGGILTGGFTGGPQQLVVAADFNSDATPDLAVVAPAYNLATVMLGNGDCTLASRYDIKLPASATTAAVITDDLNKDGKLDIALTQYSQSLQGEISGFITSLFGNGDGTFQAPLSTQSADMGIGQLVSGDFRGTGNVDLAAGDVNADGGIAVYFGDGKGSFGSPVESFMVGSASPLNVGPMAIGDFNRDGKMDLAVVSENSANGSSPLYVLLSNGDGTFTANLLYNLSYGVVPAVAVADFNNDGFLDLAATTNNELLVFLGHGDGTFQNPVSYAVPTSSLDNIAVGDFNGDGRIDVVVGGLSPTLYFYAGNGDGTFQAPVAMPHSANQSNLVAADFNGDGLLDLAALPLDFVFLGNGNGVFQSGISFQATYGVATTYDGAFGDLNGDGTVDLVQLGHAPDFAAGSTVAQTATVWLSTPTLTFTASSLQFGAQNVGTTSSPQTILLSNAGNAPLSLTKIAASGDFGQTNTCVGTLKLKDGCSIQIRFTPTTNGLRNGNLTFTDNGRPGSQSLPLKGWAGPPDFAPSISPGSVTVKAGSPAKYFLIVASGDDFAGTVQLSCSGAPSKATCTLSSNSVQVVANSTSRVEVTITTTAPSSAGLLPASFATIHRLDKQSVSVLAFSIAMVCIWSALAVVSRRCRARLLPALAVCLVFSACGGSGSGVTAPPPPVSGTPVGTYTITLTMTSASSTHSLTPTLVVQ